MVAHTFNHSTQKAQAGRSLQIQGQPGLESEFQHSQDYKGKPCFKNKQDSCCFQGQAVAQSLASAACTE